MSVGDDSGRWWLRGLFALLPFPIFAASGLLATACVTQASGLQAVWVANAVMLGLMLLRRQRDTTFALAVGGCAAGLVVHLTAGASLTAAVLFAAANVAECLIAYALIARWDVRPSLDRLADVALFALACAAGTACAAVVGARAVVLLRGVPFVLAWQNWIAAVLLAQLLVTPMILLGGTALRRGWRPPPPARIAEALTLLAGMGAVTVFCMFNTQPFLFMVMPAMLVVVARLRATGAVAAAALVAVIAVAAQVTGHGPIVARIAEPAQRVLVLQLFLASSFFVSLPMAALLAERDARAAEARLVAERYRAVVEAVGDVIFRTDLDGRWTYLNPAWQVLTGRPVVACIGRSAAAHVERADRRALRGRYAAVLAGTRAEARTELRVRTAAGVRWMEVFAQPLHGTDGTIVGATGTLRDIDDRKRLEDHVAQGMRRAEERARAAATLAATDELTGLANRRAFLRQLDAEIAAASVFGRPLAVALFDIDHFKCINDSHGHAIGDEVLRQIANRTNAVVRGGDLVGRLGGEEFGVIMPRATALDAAVITERLREAMERVQPDLPCFTVSVGLAMCDERTDAAALLANADAALYRAKNGGRNQVRLAA